MRVGEEKSFLRGVTFDITSSGGTAMTIPESVRTLVTTGPLANPGSPLCAASLRKSGRPIGDDRGACPV